MLTNERGSDARHTPRCASAALHDPCRFYASGCDVVTVQKALGRSSPAVTLNTDARLWPDASERTRNTAEAMFKAAHTNAARPLRAASME